MGRVVGKISHFQEFESTLIDGVEVEATNSNLMQSCDVSLLKSVWHETRHCKLRHSYLYRFTKLTKVCKMLKKSERRSLLVSQCEDICRVCLFQVYAMLYYARGEVTRALKILTHYRYESWHGQSYGIILVSRNNLPERPGEY